MSNPNSNSAGRADTNLSTRDRDSFPKPTRIAKQVRARRSTVERCRLGLREKGLVRRRGPRRIDSGCVVRPTGLAPLAASLEQIAGVPAEKAQEDAS